MPTPASGTISMNDMRVHINRATGSSISMSEMRARYGGSGAISFSDLYDSEGFIVNCSTYSSKFFSADGWSQIFAFGSVTPNEGNGHVQFAANSWLNGAYSTPPGSGASAVMNIYGDAASGFSQNVTSGYRATDITRVVVANVARAHSASTNNEVTFTYDFPQSGSVHCLVKF